MGIFSAIRDTIEAVSKPIISTANALDETVSMATTYVHNRTVSQKITDKQEVMVSTAETLAVLQTKLDADEKLREIYDSLEKEFA